MTDPDTPNDQDDTLERKQEFLDKFRGTGVGVEDPNIVGDRDAGEVAPDEEPDGGLAPGRAPETRPPGA